MAETFSKRELFGGAITVSIPKDFVDASTIRQIPDHQEVFLSRKTLTSLIFEINEGVNPPQPSNQGPPDPDSAAILFCAQDLLDTAFDTFHPTAPPSRVTFLAPSLAAYPARTLKGIIQQQSLASSSSTTAGSALDQSAATAPAPPPPLRDSPPPTHLSLLLLRLTNKRTDILVQAAVPTAELAGNSEALAREDYLVERVVGEIVQTMEVKDWGLFGGGGEEEIVP